MPAVSQAQRAFLYARFGHAWAKKHHFDNKGKLPPHVGKGRPANAVALANLFATKTKHKRHITKRR